MCPRVVEYPICIFVLFYLLSSECVNISTFSSSPNILSSLLNSTENSLGWVIYLTYFELWFPELLFMFFPEFMYLYWISFSCHAMFLLLHSSSLFEFCLNIYLCHFLIQWIILLGIFLRFHILLRISINNKYIHSDH
jgi:hypothetical protein